MQDTSFRTLLYRYFFFGWLFKDVTRGNLFERAAAWRHNREQARWLPTYMWRWAGWGLFFYGVGGVLELVLDAPLLSMLFYVPSALSVPIGAILVAAYIGFKALPGPL
ncbi:MAG TPA: hypothetical protein VEA40_14675 [Ramlibacter sp.]|nr:hypothetical protein [Ramlibacter sp.]